MPKQFKKKSVLEVIALPEQQDSLPSAKNEDSGMIFAQNIKIQQNGGAPMEEIDEESRKELSWLLMTLNIFAVVASCFQNGLFIYAPEDIHSEVGMIFASIMVFDIVVCLYTSCYLTEKWEMLQLYMLLDNILLVFIAASIGFIGFNNFRSDGSWTFSLISFAFPIDFFFLIGNFRCLMVRGEWSKWRIISYKFSLLVCCIMFFEIGVYFITVDYSYTNRTNTSFDDQVKELMLLNVFGTFSLIIEIYSKMTDLDHTGELQSTYQIKQFNDNEMANNLIEFSEILKAREDAEKIGLLESQK